jgi:hypothetical protein
MAIDIKREEIQKLEEQAKTREQILKHSEKLLDGDSARFEQFLKDSDDRAMKAIQRFVLLIIICRRYRCTDRG